MKFTLPARASQKSGRNRAMVLIDCLIYIAVLLVVLELAFSVFYHAMESSRLLRRSADDIAAAMRTGERWRQDVRTATAAPTTEASPAGQLLHLPHPSGEIIYRFSEGKLSRQAGANAPWTDLLSGIKSSRMEADPRRKVVAWRWELELNPRRKSARVVPLFTFEAVPQAAVQP
jgi:hypothetical protein